MALWHLLLLRVTVPLRCVLAIVEDHRVVSIASSDCEDSMLMLTLSTGAMTTTRMARNSGEA